MVFTHFRVWSPRIRTNGAEHLPGNGQDAILGDRRQEYWTRWGYVIARDVYFSLNFGFHCAIRI